MQKLTKLGGEFIKMLAVVVGFSACSAAVTIPKFTSPPPPEITELVQHLKSRGPSEKPLHLDSKSPYYEYHKTIRESISPDCVYGNFSNYRAITWRDLSYRVISGLSADLGKLTLCETKLELNEQPKKQQKAMKLVTTCYKDNGADGSVDEMFVGYTEGSHDDGVSERFGIVHGGDNLKRCLNRFGTLSKCVTFKKISGSQYNQPYQKAAKIFLTMGNEELADQVLRKEINND